MDVSNKELAVEVLLKIIECSDDQIDLVTMDNILNSIHATLVKFDKE